MTDPQRTAPAPSSTGRRRAPRSRGRRVATVVVGCVVALAMVAGLSVVFLYRQLNSNLTVLDPSGLLTGRPEKTQAEDLPAEPVNVLVMGSDTRSGAGNNIDNLTEEGARSDTTLLFHLSADRERAYGISIPRDSIVDRPDCRRGRDDVVPGETDVVWNEAFSVGGPLCTVQQFEQLTGVFVDHFVVVDFNGFRDMVDAIDGVEVCIPEDISDPEHGIDIEAGTREVSGFEALNYVRARYTLGDGSDIGRIKRQQAFIAAMANKVVSRGVLARVDRLVGFLDAATRSLVVDPGLASVVDIARLGVGFRNIGLDKIRFSTVPFTYDTRPGFEGRVVWTAQAEQVWARVSADEPLTERLEDTAISADDVPGATAASDAPDAPDASGAASPTASASPSSPGGTGSASGEETVDPERAAELEAAGLCS